MVKWPFRKSIYVALILLQGCFGGVNYAPILERKERAKFVPNHHIVKRGETLYSIAWRYNMEVRKLATANGIDSSYLIFPGQKIVLKKTGLAMKKSSSKPTYIKNKLLSKQQKQVTNSDKPFSRSPPSVTSSQQRPLSHLIRWRWPARGALGRSFSSSGGIHKGIDIKGKLGEPVLAAGGGKVVYAGSGLVGYGKLLIIKHDEYYLSAYGHNRKLLVEEGELVKEGQRIADIGDTGTDEVKLHFEIRHNGKPVDPLKLLPKRR